jgi:hypothetical protein
LRMDIALVYLTLPLLLLCGPEVPSTVFTLPTISREWLIHRRKLIGLVKTYTDRFTLNVSKSTT